MVAETWVYLSWLVKVILYLGVAFVTGGLFSYYLLGRYANLQQTLLKYITWGAGIGLVTSVLGFFFLIGSFSNTGLSGMWDSNYISLLINTPIGHAYMIRSISFALILLLMLIKLSKARPIANVEAIVIGLLILPILFSFSQLGHVTHLDRFGHLLLSLHVFAMSLWMGSLYPLWKTSTLIHGLPLKERMHVFGQIAAVIVAILATCGISIVLLLVQDFNTLLSTAYGQGFIIKILLVLSILLLAAFNKWYFTPRLQDPKFAKQLSYVICFEMLLGLSILFTTGYITTVVGLE